MIGTTSPAHSLSRLRRLFPMMSRRITPSLGQLLAGWRGRSIAVVVVLIAIALPAFAQTVPLGPRFVLPYQTVVDSNGVPIPGALLNFYSSGTNTRLATYSDPLLTVPNSNPVVANAAGVFPNIFLAGNYKVVLTDGLGNQIWTADPVDSADGSGGIVIPGVAGHVPVYDAQGNALVDTTSVSSNQNFYFGSGKPWCDVRAKGATASAGGTNTDDTAAFTACQSLMPSGGTIYVPNGAYCVSSTFTISVSGIQLVGESKNSTALEACGVDNSIISISGSISNVAIRGISIFAKGSLQDVNDTSFGSAYPAVVYTGCEGCRIDDAIIYGGSTNVTSTSLIYMSYVVGGYAYDDLMDLTGGAFINDSSADQAWPSGTPPTILSLSSIPAWSNNQSVATNGIVSLGGYILQAVVGGTTAASGPGPVVRNYGTSFTDGTVTWQAAGNASTVAWNFNGEVYIKFIDASGAQSDGIYIAGGTFKCYACLASATTGAPVAIAGGSLVEFTDLTTGPGITTNTAGLITTNGFIGFLNISGGQILGDFGIVIEGGSFAISGANIQSFNQYGLDTANGITNWSATGNVFSGGKCLAYGTGNNYSTFLGNICNGGTITGTPGTHSAEYGNDGSAIPVVNGGTGVATITGAIKGNGTSAFTQAACADLSNGGTSCAANTGTSGGNVPLLNGNNTTSGNNMHSGTETFSSQIIPAYGTPTIASGACGATTNGTLAAGSTNQSGEVIIASATTTTCTVSFSTTLAAAPLACVLQAGNAQAATELANEYISAITTGHFVITGTALASTSYYYHCF